MTTATDPTTTTVTDPTAEPDPTAAPERPRLAVADMAARLTVPFARGSDQLHLTVRGTGIDEYTFGLHLAQFGSLPEPLYILQARQEIEATTVTLTVTGGATFDVTLPDGLAAGTSVPLPTPTGLLTGIQSTGLAGPQEDYWRITALLGTTARLLWAVGWERDHLRGQIARTLGVRGVEHAGGVQLDHIGAGLGVVRSPGETDDAYKRRLTVARRWTLPTPAGLEAALNDAVGPVDGKENPFVVEDTDAELRRGLLPLRIVPTTVLAGRSIDIRGTVGVLGIDLTPPDADDPFHPDLLVTLDPAHADTDPPAGPDADPRKVQPGVAAALGRLAPLLTGRVRVRAGYDPHAADARATGRAVLLSHPATDAGRLAALAHRAGFDLVTHRQDGLVYAECAPGDLLGIGPGTGVLPVGGTLVLTALPTPPPSDSLVRWSTVPCGAGRAQFAPPAGAPPGPPASTTAEGPTATLTGTAAGRLVVAAELRLGGLTLTASREITVHPVTVADGHAIGSDGTPDPDPPPPEPPGDAQHPVFLVRHDDPVHVDYGAEPGNHVMRRETLEHLDRLIALLPAGAAQLAVRRDLGAGASALATEGRELRLAHPDLAAGPLAALAHRAGFTHVRVAGPTVVVSQAAQDPVRVTAPHLSDGVLETGATTTLAVVPTAAEVGAAGVLVWSTGDGAASLVTTGPGETSVRGERPGPAWVQAAYRIGDKSGPYQMTVRLRDELAGHTLTPATHALVVNLLAGLRPLGVEVVTRTLTGGSP
ncbi:hypothetical protein ACIOHE_04845 [Streptomyces sp. NPDC087851]|uniref:hypothetical protein n=1 Tax=Streptomyces sp. NPDC087851 TaxID=3365810 RepID=UPI00381090BC